MLESITVQEFHDKMQTNDVFLLDVRATAAYDEWKISGKNIVSVNIQTSKLKEFGPETYLELPKDREIIVTCAKGNASREAAQLLREHGYQAIDLLGGMQAWSDFYYIVPVVIKPNYTLLQINRPAKGCLSYMLLSDQQAVVVDPARNEQYYVNLAKQNNATITHVFDTHCHADHLSGGLSLAKATDATYAIAAEEMQQSTIPYSPLHDGETFSVGQTTLEVLAIPTPGHTPGSTSFFIDNSYLLAGDTVFVSGLGRPDLGGKAQEWAALLYDTVVSQLHQLNDDVLILPAHYADFREIGSNGVVGETLLTLRKENELLGNPSDLSSFTQAVTGQLGQTPPNYEKIVQINRGFIKVSEREASELEIGPNRCAVKHLP